MNARPDEMYPKIRKMAIAAKVMVTEALDAYVRQDLSLARKIMAHDDVVDDYFSQVKMALLILSPRNLLRGSMRWTW